LGDVDIDGRGLHRLASEPLDRLLSAVKPANRRQRRSGLKGRSAVLPASLSMGVGRAWVNADFSRPTPFLSESPQARKL
jgi:hypothetical protein